MQDAASSSSTVHSLLLQEAQQEIASLRSELYSTRRQAEDRRIAVASISATRDSLLGQVEHLERSLGECRHQLSVLQGVDVQLAAIRDANATMQRELELGASARKILESELAGERKERRSAEQAKAVIESDRSRLQKARDELSAQLRVAQQQAREAEAEQLHAEDEAATLRAELGALRASSLSAAAEEGAEPRGGLPHGGARAAWGEPSSGHHAGPHGAGPSSSSSSAYSPDMAAAAVAEAAALSRQLEDERSRAAALLDALHTARAEASVLQQQQQRRSGSELSLSAVTADALALRGRAEAAESRAALLAVQLKDATESLSAAQQHAASAEQRLQQQAEAAAWQSSGHHVSTTQRGEGAPFSAPAAPVSSSSTALEAGLGENGGPSGRSPRHHHFSRVSSSGSIAGASFSARLAAAAEGGGGVVEGGGDTGLLLAELERCQAQVGAPPGSNNQPFCSAATTPLLLFPPSCPFPHPSFPPPPPLLCGAPAGGEAEAEPRQAARGD